MLMRPKTIKFCNDFLPLILFFGTYKFFGIITATLVMMVATIFGTALHYIYYKELPRVMLFVNGMVIIFGSLTVFTNNPYFIKIKPTVLYLFFGGALLFGLLREKFYIKELIAQSSPTKLSMPDKMWRTFTARFIMFFVVMAVLNEIVWRNFSESTWVAFKSFGSIPLLLIFLVVQMSFLKKHVRL